MLSYPTPDGATRTETMSPSFLKLHPGAPIHYFTSAFDAEYHTHPFVFVTHIVVGGYIEEVLSPNEDGSWRVETFRREPGTSHVMPIDRPHRLISLIDGPCITRCEYGPTVQKPGFVRIDERGFAQHRYHDDTNESDWRTYTRE